jgi:hypothetical protein
VRPAVARRNSVKKSSRGRHRSGCVCAHASRRWNLHYKTLIAFRNHRTTLAQVRAERRLRKER